MKQILILAVTISIVTAAIDYTVIKLKFIGDDLNDVKTIKYGESFAPIISSKYFLSTRKTMIYINSFRQNFDSFDVATIVNAYLTRRTEWNIIYCDWYNYTNNFLFIPTLQALDGVANSVKVMLTSLKNEAGATPFTHLVGFGLGAHLSGYIGRKFSVNRITGLDPSGCFMYTSVLFTFTNTAALGRFDAPQVDVIHTSANKFGYPNSQGSLDFWVNGGSTQAGCNIIDSLKAFIRNQDIANIYVLACSHTRAVYYYAETVTRPPTPVSFLASYCGPLVSNYNPTTCTNTNKQVSMGYHAAHPVCGILDLDCVSTNYYVKTKTAAPYSMS